MKSGKHPRLWWIVTALLLAGAVILPLVLDRSRSSAHLVLYCAHDAIFADSIIQMFESRTGIQVDVRYDEEASKSLGLTNLLISEKAAPRCDVFWNNQSLGTIRLKQNGVLAPYQGEGYKRIPAAFRDPEGYWTGFAARMRVYIVNRDRMEASPEAIQNLLNADSLTDVAIAKPLFGTTLTHYSVLSAEMGLNALQEWHRSLQLRGIREVRGNGAVKDLVAEGTCALGFTDTDDVFVALEDQKPVTMLPVRTTDGKTLVIPNTVALIQNCRNPEAAKQLIDFLLSPEVELLLAESAARQIPLGSVTSETLSPEVRQLMEWSADARAMDDAAACQPEVLTWLTSEYQSP